jgi:hypothetical protein
MNLTDASNSSDVLRAASSIVLPLLPYSETALELALTAKTLSSYYGKHHKAYVDNLNKPISGTDYSDLSLEEIIQGSVARPERAAVSLFGSDWVWRPRVIAALPMNVAATATRLCPLVLQLYTQPS